MDSDQKKPKKGRKGDEQAQENFGNLKVMLDKGS